MTDTSDRDELVRLAGQRELRRKEYLRHCGRTPPQASTALCGAFQLQLLLLDRLGPHHTEPWRATWTGLAAQRFWQEHHAALLPGAALVVELERARIHTLACRPPRSEVHARVIHCALVPARSQEPASASTRHAHPQHPQHAM